MSEEKRNRNIMLCKKSRQECLIKANWQLAARTTSSSSGWSNFPISSSHIPSVKIEMKMEIEIEIEMEIEMRAKLPTSYLPLPPSIPLFHLLHLSCLRATSSLDYKTGHQSLLNGSGPFAGFSSGLGIPGPGYYGEPGAGGLPGVCSTPLYPGLVSCGLVETGSSPASTHANSLQPAGNNLQTYTSSLDHPHHRRNNHHHHQHQMGAGLFGEAVASSLSSVARTHGTCSFASQSGATRSTAADGLSTPTLATAPTCTGAGGACVGGGDNDGLFHSEHTHLQYQQHHQLAGLVPGLGDLPLSLGLGLGPAHSPSCPSSAFGSASAACPATPGDDEADSLLAPTGSVCTSTGGCPAAGRHQWPTGQTSGCPGCQSACQRRTTAAGSSPIRYFAQATQSPSAVVYASQPGPTSHQSSSTGTGLLDSGHGHGYGHGHRHGHGH
ncbi:unnamed protein product, partial [Protopolystoma xenopodis]